jgi:hypothetical protein
MLPSAVFLSVLRKQSSHACFQMQSIISLSTPSTTTLHAWLLQFQRRMPVHKDTTCIMMTASPTLPPKPEQKQHLESLKFQLQNSETHQALGVFTDESKDTCLQ